MNIDKYLYEIIEDYKDANSIEERSKIFKNFCSSIWSNSNKRRTYIKTIKFKVRSDLLGSEIGQIFNAWSIVEYVGYKAMSRNIDWCSLIRQKINNLYTRYFDDEVILNKDYMDLLKTPYNLYYRWIKGVEIDIENLTNIIDNSMREAAELKHIYQKQKMKISWQDYKLIIEDILKNIFNNCKSIEEYEMENLTNKYIYELSNEDNSYVSYICSSLEGEMLKFQKKYYNVRDHKKYKRCKRCGNMIENTGNKKTYCNQCSKEIRKEKRIKYNKNYYDKKIRTNRNIDIQP